MWVKIDDISSSSQEEIWKPSNVGDVIEGEFIGRKLKTGNMLSDIIQIKSGDKVWNLWETTVLKTKFSQINEGEKVKVIYQGQVKGKSLKPYHDFDVFVDRIDDNFSIDTIEL